MKFKSILITFCLLALFVFSSTCSAKEKYVINPYKTSWPLWYDDVNGVYRLLYDANQFQLVNHAFRLVDENCPLLKDYVPYADSNYADDRDANYIKHAAGAVTSTDINASVIQITSVDINIAELKTLFSAPKTLLAAPGTHKYYDFLGATVIYESNSAGYETVGNNMTIKYTNGSGAAVSGTLTGTGFLDQTTTDKIAKVIPAAVATTTATSIENQILALCMATADPCGAGNGTLHLKIASRTVDSGL